MRSTRFVAQLFRLLAISAVIATAADSQAAEKYSAAKASKSQAAAVELFAGIEAGQITARYIPQDALQANLLVTNKTDRPLTVRLPTAFAGVPVQAQFFIGGAQGRGQQQGGFNGFNNLNGANTNQSTGTGTQPNGFMNIPPEKTLKLALDTVCLEHGKAAPNPRLAYEVRPLADQTTAAGVRELLPKLADGKTSQMAIQAAAWHLANGMTWKQLAAKKVDRLGKPDSPYFTKKQLDKAKLLAEAALNEAKAKPQPTESSPTARPIETASR